MLGAAPVPVKTLIMEIETVSVYPCVVVGSLGAGDAGAAIQTAIQQLPLGIGGCVDARGLPAGQQLVTATITVDRPVTLLLGAVQLLVKATANPAFLVSPQIVPNAPAGTPQSPPGVSDHTWA